ncbi:MAG: SH3 domain-containing protein [Syntrophaceae bacterium]|nr:SH3 domain-containing protein [Syntrophaceae bacterium]
MKTRFLFAAILFFLILQMNCAGPSVRLPVEKAPESPQPGVSERFPKKVYNLGFSSAWEDTLRSLRETNMPLLVLDKDRGIIRTDYIRGAEFRNQEKAFSVRYKYDISLSREAETRTGLHIRCHYEIKEKRGPSFENANHLYPDEVMGLEDELYQIIESTLRRTEASRPARSRAELKGEFPPPAKESVPIRPPSPKIFLLTKKNAPLREGPSAESKIILTFRPGRKVEKIEESGNWVRVKIWGSIVGWVQKDFLEEAPP